MLRFYWTIFWNIYHIYMIPKMGYMAKHTEKYDETERYRIARRAIYYMMRSGNIKTVCDGLENLPKDGGYVMYPNHQGKFDALSIMITHPDPCSVVVDDAVSYGILIKEFIDLVGGKRMKLDDVRQAFSIIQETSSEVKEGRRYIIFSEGGYTDNKNTLQEFKPGSFKMAMMAKAPIVPVALTDSYKVFGENSLAPVTAKVHYMPPLYYEDYKDMNSREICALVKETIQCRIDDELKEHKRMHRWFHHK
jgi:1-acyl-sn-glycerol-3-phosphate acyltransferase